MKITNTIRFLLAVPLLLVNIGAAAQDFSADPERMESRIQALGEFGANPEGGVSRVADIREGARAAGHDV